jgi:hypothetical protein
MDAEEERPGSSLQMKHMAGSQYEKELTQHTTFLKMKKRINAKFKGLLEVVHTKEDSSFHDFKVYCLHITVK